MKKYNVELSQDEIFILQVSLQDSKKFKESFRLEDEGNDLTGLTKSLNDSVDKSVKEREDLYNKLHEVIFDRQENEISDYEDIKELSHEELVSRVMKLTEINYSLEDSNEELRETIKELENTDTAKVSKIADFFTDYDNIQNRYDSNKVQYQMQNLEDITRIFGLEIQYIKGFSSLTEEDQEVFSKGILRYLNSYGLGNRIQHLPSKVWKEGNEFRFETLLNGLEFMDSKGKVY